MHHKKELLWSLRVKHLKVWDLRIAPGSFNPKWHESR